MLKANESSSFSIADAILRGNNNFDMARLILAAMVIYGHSFSVTPSPDMGYDLVSLTGYNAGDLGIKTFFFVSGLLVANSLMTRRSPVEYALSRAFRILPALAAVTLVVALVIGPLVTSKPLLEYLSDSQTWAHIWHQMTAQTWGQAKEIYSLPGVFEGNPAGTAVNTPTWSISAEVFGYMLLLAFAVSAGLSRLAVTALFVVIAIDTLLPAKFLFSWLPQDSTDFRVLPLSFAFGVLLAAWKDEARITLAPILAMACLVYLFRGSDTSIILGYGVFFLAVFWAFTQPFALRFTPKVDVSYGMYLWGWPIQQIYAAYFPNTNHLVALVVCIILAGFMGYVSAVWVETPARDMGRRLIKTLSLRSADVSAAF